MDHALNVYQQKEEMKNENANSNKNSEEIISLSDDPEEMAPIEPQKKIDVLNNEKPTNATKKRSSSLGSANDDYRIKRRKLRVAGAPKMPLTGYVRYMNERRETLRKEYPSKTAIEHTKMIGEEWQHLPEERKAPYIKAAAEDKERYTAELNHFLKLNPDVLETERAKIKAANKGKQDNKNILKEKSEWNGKSAAAGLKETNAKAKDNGNLKSEQQQNTKDSRIAKQLRNTSPVNNNSNNNNNNGSVRTTTPGEIPIFTNEFLDHNKYFDAELRTLRKSKTDLEQQNAVLEKHVENMKFGVEKLTNENDELQKKNRLLEVFLTKLKGKLAKALSGLAIPSEPQGATLENIEKYMADLQKMVFSNTHGPASLNKAKDIIRKLDLEIHL